MFKKMVIITGAIMLSSFAAHAQDAKPAEQPATTTQTPAVTTPDSVNPAAPVPGSNSFTEDQAKERIVSEGYTDVTALKLGDDGIWQADAMKNAAKVKVNLDYQGNVTAK